MALLTLIILCCSYGGVVWAYEASATPLYFMFTQRTWHWIPKDEIEYHSMPGPAMIDIGLAISRDGINFTHVGKREPFIGGGLAGSFDSQFQWLLPNPVASSESIDFFYAGTNTDHDSKVHGPTKKSGIARCNGRLDGLMSLDSPLHPSDGNVSIAVTKPLTVSADDLFLNVNTGAGGVVRVEILNASDDTPLPLFSDSAPRKGGGRSENHQNTIAIVTNSIAKKVQWHVLRSVNGVHTWETYGLQQLRGQKVKLRILMVGAKLYSYSFG